MTLTANNIVGDGGGWPPGLDQKLPRQARLRLFVSYIFWGIFGGVLILPVFAILIGFVSAHRTSQLLVHGVHVQGTIRALTVIQQRGNIVYRVDYGFIDPAPPDPIEAIQSGWTGVSEPQFRRLFVGGSLDVVFLHGRPDISALDMNLVTASPAPWKPLEIVIGAIGLIAMPVGFVFARIYWRDRRLLQWGRHTAATVIEVSTRREGRRNGTTWARFEFRDETGMIRQGLARSVGIASQHAVGSLTRSFAAGDTATVLFDPANPARADLYPMRLLTLAPDQRGGANDSRAPSVI